jgi:hypothetical protein
MTPVKMLIPLGALVFEATIFGIISLEFKPAFSAKILGMISKALANLL